MHQINSGELAGWCRQWLGAEPIRLLFEVRHLSTVFGLELSDGRRVVVKVRPPSDRIAGCVAVQRELWQAGFPCPEPLVGPEPLRDLVATAEQFVAGGEMLEPGLDSPQLFAEALARLVKLAPEPSTVPSLEPPPAWVWWKHTQAGVWPEPDDMEFDLNSVSGPSWLEDAQRRTRARLLSSDLSCIIGHCDWWSDNLRWVDRQLHVVHDWDSVVSLPEAAIAGAAAAIFPANGVLPGATLEESHAFLSAYQHARGQNWTTEELQVSWAAGLFVRAFDAKKDLFRGQADRSLLPLAGEVEERRRLAGA